MQIAKCTLRCSFNVPYGALSVALTSEPSTFYAFLSAPQNKILDALSSAAQSATSISPFTESYCTLLRADNCMNKGNLKCTFQCSLRYTFLGTFIYILKCTFRYNSRRIIRCYLNCIIKRTLNAFIVVPFALSCALSGAQ